MPPPSHTNAFLLGRVECVHCDLHALPYRSAPGGKVEAGCALDLQCGDGGKQAGIVSLTCSVVRYSGALVTSWSEAIGCVFDPESRLLLGERGSTPFTLAEL